MTHEFKEDPENLPSTEIDSQQLAPPYYYHRDPGYRPWLIASMPKKPTPYEEILAMMARHLKYAVFASKVVFIFSIIIAMDFMLPKRLHEVKITGYNRSPSSTYQMELNDGSVVNVSKKAM